MNKLKDLKSKELIDQQLYNKLKPTDSPAPRFYGLPKIHKTGTPLRPIVSYTGTPLYKLSKYVAGILSSYIEREGRNSINSKVFSEYVRTLHINDDEVMVSFDVTSLYTNVPIRDTLTVIEDLLNKDSKYEQKTKIPRADLLELIEFLLTKTWFIFNGECFTQLDGVAMGGPASSVIADIYMQHYDKTALSTFEKPVKAYERYVGTLISFL